MVERNAPRKKIHQERKTVVKSLSLREVSVSLLILDVFVEIGRGK